MNIKYNSLCLKYCKGGVFMFKEKDLRKIALGIAKKDNKVLVEKGHDKIEQIDFYRCLGGGIEENETPLEAVKREFKEELNIDIIVNKELGTIDSHFVYNGKNGHELVYLFDITIPEESLKENYTILDNDIASPGEWISIDEFKSGEKIIFPKGIIKYL